MPVSDTELEAVREHVEALRAQSAERDAQRAKAINDSQNDATYLNLLQESVRLEAEIAEKDRSLAVEEAARQADTAVLQEQIRAAADQLQTPPLPAPVDTPSDPIPVTETLQLSGLGNVGDQPADSTGEDK